MEPQCDMNMKRPAPPSVPVMQPGSEDDSMRPCKSKRPFVRSFSAPSCTYSTISKESTDAEAGASILDVLNVDCWRLVFDQLCINDVVRSERVSRAWQQVVLVYLSGVHNYEIIDNTFSHSTPTHFTPSQNMPRPWYKKHRKIKLMPRNAEVLQNMINKMGHYFISMVAFDIDGKMLEAIATKCQNLKDLKISIHQSIVETENLGLLTEWRQLKRVTFYATDGGDSLLNSIVTSETLEELTISSFKNLTGSFLAHLRTHNLKTLRFINCKSLVIENIVLAVHRFTGLTRLDLCHLNPPSPVWSLHLLLDGLPNLEHLCLNLNYCEVDLVGEVTAAIGRLRRLKELNLFECLCVTDEWLAAAARCPALRAINVSRTRVTARGVIALCRARPGLAKLGVVGLHVTDEDLAACARSCPGLEHLDAWDCPALKPRLPAVPARFVARPLRLRPYKDPEYLERHSEMIKHKIHEGVTFCWESSFDEYRYGPHVTFRWVRSRKWGNQEAIAARAVAKKEHS